MTSAGGESEVHDATTMLQIMGLWLVAWFFLKHMCWICYSQQPVSMMHCAARHERERYLRRLCRSQVYCVLSVYGAFQLLRRYENFPHDLLYDFSKDHQFFFAMAVTHWVVAVFEDRECGSFLAAGLEMGDIPYVRSPVEFLQSAYVLHHMVAAGGFSMLLCLQQCAAVGVFGLLFELPVIFLNYRDMAIVKRPVPLWLQLPSRVSGAWRVFHFMWLIGRGGPTAVYLYSLWAWQDALAELPTSARVTYHVMAIFFTMLNLTFQNTALSAWHASDLKVAERHQRAEEVAAGPQDDLMEDGADLEESGFKEELREEIVSEGVGFGSTKANLALKPIREEDFLGGKLHGKVFIAIDGAAFDVTDFRKEHPGGARVLEQYIGQDATEAFRKIGHSTRAKAMLSKYMIGPIAYPREQYRIFEQNLDTLYVFSYVLYALVSVTLLVSASSRAWWCFSKTGEPLVDGLVLDDALLMSWMVATGLGGFGFVIPFCMRSLRCALSWRDHIAAIGILAFLTSLPFVCEAAPSGLPADAPDGLELLAAAVFIAEACLHHKQTPCIHHQISLAILASSWVVRTSGGEVDFQNMIVQVGKYTRIAGSAVASATALSLTMRVLVGVAGGSRELIAAACVHALQLCGVYGALCIVALHLFRNPSALGAVLAGPQPVWFFIFCCLIGLTAMLFMALSVDCGYVCSSSFSVRLVGVALLLITWLGEGLHSYRWLAYAGFLWHLSQLGKQNKAFLEERARDGTFKRVPAYLIGAQGVWDYTRIGIATIIWKIIAVPLKNLLSGMLPQEYCLYVCEIPIMNLGKDVELGMAAHYAPKHIPKHKVNSPQYFVCNVGQITLTDARGLQDTQRTCNTLRDVWREFSKPDVRGLVANVIAVFPEVNERHALKEINLSAWESEKAAYDWYVKSAGHQHVLQQHGGGLLRTFGNLLVSLKPAGKIRHQDRCQLCARVVEAPEVGQRPPRTCGVCGGPTFGYPVF